MIVIVDFGMGNLRSVEKAFLRLNAKARISSDFKVIETAEKLILPGVGNFARGMEKLRSLHMIDILDEKVLLKKIPVLGICLGMQLFANRSEEGDVEGLGWVDAQVLKFNFPTNKKKRKIPHMGWNNLQINRDTPLLKHISEDDSFYFVHSYHVVCNDNDRKNILTNTNYGIQFVSSLQKNNIIGVQFHPEKSHSSGLRLLKNFIDI
jgi:glutamine amidotransferase